MPTPNADPSLSTYAALAFALRDAVPTALWRAFLDAFATPVIVEFMEERGRDAVPLLEPPRPGELEEMQQRLRRRVEAAVAVADPGLLSAARAVVAHWDFLDELSPDDPRPDEFFAEEAGRRIERLRDAMLRIAPPPSPSGGK